MIMGRDIIRRVDLDGETFEDYDGEEYDTPDIEDWEMFNKSFNW